MRRLLRKLFQTKHNKNTNRALSFSAEESYTDYILNCRQKIATEHRELPNLSKSRMVAINAPFEWHPDPALKTEHGYRRAAIMIHGLNESAFSLRDISHHLVEQGFLVRGILLPGHGTTPRGLLNVGYQDWLDTLLHIIRDTHQHAQEVYLYGFSLGTTLSLHAALLDEAIEGLVLFAPAIASKSPLAYLARWHKYASQKIRGGLWRKKRQEVDYAKYCSSSYDCISETIKGMNKVRRLLKKKNLKTPIFAVATTDDETINTPTFIKYFKKITNDVPRKLILYTTGKPDPELLQHPHVVYRNSAYPSENILNFSHTALHHAPDNPHYGRNPDYYDYLHYAYAPDNSIKAEYLGAITARNMRHENLARLHYNPDFKQLLLQHDEFLNQLN